MKKAITIFFIIIVYVLMPISFVLYWCGMILKTLSHLLRLEIGTIQYDWETFPETETHISDQL